MDKILSSCKKGTVVAFKTKGNKWFTGVISFIEKLNKSDYVIRIDLTIPIEPQWYDGEKTVYYLEDISNLIILENGKISALRIRKNRR